MEVRWLRRKRVGSLPRKGCCLKAWFAGGGVDGCGRLMVMWLLIVVSLDVEFFADMSS